ncbi:putative beta-lysine N-acetyltransferase [Cellulosilyticum sp. I15G10I2]|uniref:putative beta-lysine N-acetyltransferase n=1 Tax=Cellulosilyticum sp. I15G10I2 TaxID=1892843 RepID=UPI00085C91EC|nr:putative beta-lysine N-acetyltransferase [Cellulosilyticum sp. I15G10I2]
MIAEIPKMEKLDFDGGTARIRLNAFNQRIKIVSFEGEITQLMHKLTELAAKEKVGKIFSIVSQDQIAAFKDQGFIMEAKINHFLNGEPGYFLSKFMLPERKMSMLLPEEEEVLIKSREYKDEDYHYEKYDEYKIRSADKEDAKGLAKLYDSVFETYPSPMNDADYIQYVMDHDIFFKVAVYQDEIVSAASADMDSKNLNVEMTDCATYKAHRGQGLMGRLIFDLEKEMQNRHYKVLYSTARAISAGMNIVFAKHNYEYGGRLVNHCHICGQFENMNIWVKEL